MFSKRSREFITSKALLIFSVLVSLLVAFIFIGLLIKSLPILKQHSIAKLLFSVEWFPVKNKFGLLAFIVSTFWVTLLSIVIAVPLCILTSVFLTEYANKSFLRIINPLIDVLAGIPSVIFGVWGILIVVPFVRNFIGPIFKIDTSGYTILSGGLVLSIMIIPVIIHVITEVLKCVPQELKEASLSLGATKWETIKFVVLKKAMPGIIAAIILGISRAFGETIAVLMVVGNVIKIPSGILDSGYPLPALIANNYGEMLSIPMYESALLFSALVLLVIVVIFNFFSRLVLIRIEKKVGVVISE